MLCSPPYERGRVINKYHLFWGSTFGTVEAAKMYCQLPTSGNFNIQSIQSPLLNTEAPRWHCRIFFHSAALSANWKEIGSYRFFFRLFVCFSYTTEREDKTKRKRKANKTMLYPDISSHYFRSVSFYYLKSRQETIWFLSNLLQLEMSFYWLKASPKCLCTETHLHCYQLCVIAVLPQIGAFQIQSNCIVFFGQTRFRAFGSP